MGLTMGQRKAVTREMAERYRSASRRSRQYMLDELCALTGWHRDHARKALRLAGRAPRVSRPRRPPRVVYDESVLVPLRKIWAVMDAPAGKRLAPFLPEIVARLRACGELDLDDATAAKLSGMSAATIDRRLAPDRARLSPRGRSGTKPGSLLKSQIPIRTWSEWDDTRPGFVEIDLVGHDGGNPWGSYCRTLTMTDIATGWTETRAISSKAQPRVFAALTQLQAAFPFPLLGIDSDNGVEFINATLLAYCHQNQITFTRSRPGKKNDNAHVEQKNWSIVRQAVGYHRYQTSEHLQLLNELYALLRLATNYFSPQQKLLTKTRVGAKITRRHDTAQTPYQRLCADPSTPETTTATLTRHYQTLNPAQIRRDIHALNDQLLHLVTHHPSRAPTREATKTPKRAS